MSDWPRVLFSPHKQVRSCSGLYLDEVLFWVLVWPKESGPSLGNPNSAKHPQNSEVSRLISGTPTPGSAAQVRLTDQTKPWSGIRPAMFGYQVDEGGMWQLGWTVKLIDLQVTQKISKQHFRVYLGGPSRQDHGALYLVPHPLPSQSPWIKHLCSTTPFCHAVGVSRPWTKCTLNLSYKLFVIVSQLQESKYMD